jgi:threonine/homoserine/homoserine lactone efflux protein
VPRGSLLLAFLATAAVIVAIPGPSLLFTIGRALTVGRRAALLTVIGNALGLLVQSLLVAVGLGAVLAASAAAYTVVKLAGAAYLVYLGVQAIRHRGELAGALLAARSGGGEPVAAQGSDRGSSDRGSSDRSSLLQGLTVGLTNPKTLVFLSSLLPQFVDPASAPQPQILALGAVFAAMALAGDSVWALAAGRARDWFARSPRRLARLGVGGGALMIGLGVSVAVAGRPTS